MVACVYDIGDNLTKVLVGLGVTFGPLIGVVTLLLQRKVHRELTANTGHSIKDAVVRTEATVAAIADTQGVPHPTPPQGTPVVATETKGTTA